MYVHYNLFRGISAQRLPGQHTAHSHLILAVKVQSLAPRQEVRKDALEPPCQAQQISALPPPFLGGEKAQN